MQTTPRPIEASSTSSSVDLAPVVDVTGLWPWLQERLAKSIELSGGRFSKEWALQAAASGDIQRWLASGGRGVGVIATQINVYPTGLKAMEVLFVGGDEMESWFDAIYQLEAWARHRGCDVMEAGGRRGWRAKTPQGWKEAAVFFEKDLR